MRSWKYLVTGIAAVGLVGCTTSQPSLSTGAIPSTNASVPAVITSTGAAASPVSSKLQMSARATAMQFYTLYSASQFAAAWDLLSPPAKAQVPKGTWVSVHQACPGTAAGKSRVIKAVTAFGSAAIVSEGIAGTAATPSTTEDVFNYVSGQWGYSPGEVSVYRHGSTAADVAAAKTAGLCAGWKVF